MVQAAIFSRLPPSRLCVSWGWLSRLSQALCPLSCCLFFLLLVMSTTPPPGPLLSPNTPIHTRTATTDRFDPKFQDRDFVFQRLSEEMAPYFVGPMPPKVFLDHFLPDASPNQPIDIFKAGMFSGLMQASSEAEMHATFVCPDAYRPLLGLTPSSPKLFPLISQA